MKFADYEHKHRCIHIQVECMFEGNKQYENI